jgi:hypothetical protein
MSTSGYNPRYEVSRGSPGVSLGGAFDHPIRTLKKLTRTPPLDDCTNFVSQALHAGGWTEDTTWNYTRPKYTHPAGGPGLPVAAKTGGASAAWQRVQAFVTYAESTGRATPIPVSKALPGDIIVADWDGKDPKSSEFHGDHLMIVVGKQGNNPLIASHGSNRFNYPLYGKKGSQSIEGQRLKIGKPPTFTALRVNDG